VIFQVVVVIHRVVSKAVLFLEVPLHFTISCPLDHAIHFSSCKVLSCPCECANTIIAGVAHCLHPYILIASEHTDHTRALVVGLAIHRVVGVFVELLVS